MEVPRRIATLEIEMRSPSSRVFVDDEKKCYTTVHALSGRDMYLVKSSLVDAASETTLKINRRVSKCWRCSQLMFHPYRRTLIFISNEGGDYSPIHELAEASLEDGAILHSTETRCGSKLKIDTLSGRVIEAYRNTTTKPYLTLRFLEDGFKCVDSWACPSGVSEFEDFCIDSKLKRLYITHSDDVEAYDGPTGRSLFSHNQVNPLNPHLTSPRVTTIDLQGNVWTVEAFGSVRIYDRNGFYFARLNFAEFDVLSRTSVSIDQRGVRIATCLPDGDDSHILNWFESPVNCWRPEKHAMFCAPFREAVSVLLLLHHTDSACDETQRPNVSLMAFQLLPFELLFLVFEALSCAWIQDFNDRQEQQKQHKETNCNRPWCIAM